ncbi:MAG: hypothetical protein MUE88_10455 [Flavobacteriales bacterium]|nr:hypothetical protein [Flavobacteriales bacterium]
MPFIAAPHRWLLLLAVVLRAAFVMHHAHLGWQLQYDAGYYLTLAAHLEQGVYSLFHPLDIPDTTRMPGYPWLIHLLGCSVPAVLAVQVVLSAIKVLLVAQLALARTSCSPAACSPNRCSPRCCWQAHCSSPSDHLRGQRCSVLRSASQRQPG